MFALLLFQFLPAYSQKKVVKTLLSPEISSIRIDGQQCFSIELKTADVPEVVVQALMEGEYQRQVLLLAEKQANTLVISTGFSPDFELPNDKLGAHKVLSIRLEVTVPNYQNVDVYAGSCSVETSGQFQNLSIALNDGQCKLSHTAENTQVRTQSAKITAAVASGVIAAKSRYGRVEIANIPAGDSRFTLNSTEGDILVRPL
ncbi:hypothetical protein ACT6NV_07505 [Robiginitalea sp. IMCC44478]|uniref:hypothetical protein n=1 Tax=Robiginitalea sp. IMCC44478 TaxID=3459122 RepID=UPI004042E53C